jgi:mono/diheme cytochrome c family protein
VLYGMRGPIEVNGEFYDGPMPAYNFLGDEELSLILTYIRQHLGNHASGVSEEEIRSRRRPAMAGAGS